jgi:protein O-mannosyl-transferase
MALIISVLTFCLFSPALRCGFVDYDDGLYVVENGQVLKGLTAEGLGYAFRSINGGSWMPLTWITHMLDVSLFGLQPAGHHFTNILLHAASSGLLVLVLHRMTARLWLSVLVAALFAWHPLRTESVVWVAERKDVLAALLWMLGLLAYARFVQKPGTLRYSCVATCLALGLMAKPMMVSFPLLLLLLDFWPLQRMGWSWSEFRIQFWRRLREKTPLLLLIVVICGVTLWSQRRVGAMDKREVSIVERSRQVTSNYSFYVEKSFWPAQRSVVYPELPLSPVRTAGTVAILGLITGLACWRLLKWPWLAVGWFWFLGTLFPVCGIVPVGMTPVADRYSYIPSVGLALAVVWSIAEIVKALPQVQRATFIAGVILTIGLACLTFKDISRWKDSETLFAAAVNTAPHKVAYNNLAYALIKRGEHSRAIANCERAIELDPNYGVSFGNRSLAYASLGDYERAKRDYDEAVRLGARPIQPLRRWQQLTGKTVDQLASDDPEEAWHLFAGVAGLEPQSAESLRGRGNIRVKIGDVAGGITDYTKAIALRADNSALHTARGNAYARLQNWTNALADLTQAIVLSPTNAAGYQNRAVIYYRLGELDKAWNDVSQQLKLGGVPHQSFVNALSNAIGQTKAERR